MGIEILSVNLSREKGTVKTPVPGALLDERGLAGDAHAGSGHRQVSLLSEESILAFEGIAGRKIRPGEFAENLTVRGLDLEEVGYFDRLRVGGAEMEVTQFGKKCHGDSCAVFREVGACVMPREGLFCRVLRGGTVLRPGMEMELLQRPLAILVLTLSDRAARGEYPDRSGPRAAALLEDYFRGRRWHPRVERKVLSDDPAALDAELRRAREEGKALVLTTGGTGVGPRDFAPEVVTSHCDKLLPGIMEAVRIKYGLEKPNALLSRAVAGTAGETLVYAIPGSPGAVEEYLGEIVKTLEHLLLMVRGIGHG